MAMEPIYLTVDLAELETMPNPRRGSTDEVARYSTELVHGRAVRDHRRGSVEEGHRYTVIDEHQRSLCEDDRENLLAWRERDLPYDLDARYEDRIEVEAKTPRMSLLLEALERNNLTGRSEFVCLRSVLTNLGLSPYGIGGYNDLGMIVAVQKIGEVFYLYEFETQNSRERQERLSEKDIRMSYWGSNLKSYVTHSPRQPDVSPIPPLNFNSQFFSVVKTKLGDHSIILRGEVDGIKDEEYFKVKTHKRISNERRGKYFRTDKLIKWWLQSSLIGLRRVLCGFRDDNGVVRTLKWYNVHELPQEMIGRKPEVCLTFLNEFLSFVKENVQEQLVPHVLTRHPGELVFAMTIDREGQYAFLPNWYYERVQATQEDGQ